MPVTPMSPAPSRYDSVNFVQRFENLLTVELPRFITELNELQINTNAATAAAQTGAESARDQSVSARDAAIAAWGAAMAPAEILPAISKTLHSGAIVKSIIYDTSKDSDGGAWRKRCADKSWFNEALGFTGAWRNQLASTAAAWAISGAAAGDGFQNTTDGKYYVLTGTTTASEIFRGNVREFPEQVAIIAESGRVVIYDLTQVGTPMWMVFVGVSNVSWVYTGITSVVAVNGKMWTNTNSNGVLIETDFIQDSGWQWYSSPAYTGPIISKISSRNAGEPSKVYNNTTRGVIVDSTINDVAAVVLDGALIDPSTGVPIPTIAVATSGGVSVIKSDGTVANITHIEANTVDTIGFDSIGRLWVGQTNNGTWGLVSVGPVPTASIGLIAWRKSQYYPTVSPAPLGYSLKAVAPNKALATTAGLTLLKDNPTAIAKGMVAHITNAYNCGWLPGDIRGAWLADTVAETITAPELVTNGTFATDISAWTAGGDVGGTVLAFSSGTISVTAPAGANSGWAMQLLTGLVVGRTYSVSVDLVSISGNGNRYLRVGTTAGGIEMLALNNNDFVIGTNRVNFVAPASTAYISVCTYGGQTCTFDNISAKLAEPDRSVKNNGLIINGSIAKAAVATGAQLVAYSGFSASNYLRQPYNVNLDFGVGDFTYLGHYLFGTQAAHPQVIFQRGVGAGAILLQENGAYIYLLIHNGTSMVQILNWPLVSNERVHFVVTRIGGVLYLYLRGVLVFSGVNTLSLTSAELPSLFIGNDPTLANFAIHGNLCLIRSSATGMSADQVAHSYRTELALFQPNAQCTIDGNSAAVTALAYDETTDVLQVGTSWGRSAFRDLVRIESAVSTVGAITSLSANQGAHITGGASSGRYYQPAMLLRDELRRKDEARKALGKVPVFFDFDAVTSQTAFVLPKGYTTKAVYSAGTLKRNGATKDYTTSFDGFAETVTFGTAPGNTVWVSIMCVRSN